MKIISFNQKWIFKNELKNIIEKDAIYYNSFSKKAHIKMFLTNSHFYMINKYMRLLRYEEFYRKKSVGGGHSYS